MKINKYIIPSNEYLIRDFSEFSKIPTEKIRFNINNLNALLNEEWLKLSRKSSQKSTEFYKKSYYYIYRLLSEKRSVVDKLNFFNPRIIKYIEKHPGKKFLDFGGGLGIFCEIVFQMGKNVTYLDIPGLVFDFAIWRFKKYHLPINMVRSDPTHSKIDGKYDIIFTDAVIEHVTNPEETIEVLCNHVEKGGLLVILVDLRGASKEDPMHRNINIHDLHEIINNNGFKNLFGRKTFCSAWKRN